MSSAEIPALAEAVVRLASICERLNIPYAFGGALATSFWGIPRTTQDADCLVAVPALAYQAFADGLAADGFLVEDDSNSRPATVAELRGQIAARSYMSLVRQSTPVELFVPVVPLQHDILRRAVALPFGARSIRVTTAEDLILLKMVFHRQKDLLDIKGIILVQGDRLDRKYIRDWAARMLDDPLRSELDTLIAEYGAGPGDRRP